jgi:hypothetical protein
MRNQLANATKTKWRHRCDNPPYWLTNPLSCPLSSKLKAHPVVKQIA